MVVMNIARGIGLGWGAAPCAIAPEPQETAAMALTIIRNDTTYILPERRLMLRNFRALPSIAMNEV